MEIMINTILWQIITQCTGTQGVIKKLASRDPCGRKRGLKTVAFLLRLSIYNYVHTDFLRPSGGASIFVKSSFPQRKIDLQTELQATAVSVTLDREITICSVYIPPSFSLNSQHLDNLLQQLLSPYILLGDFNGHNILGVVKTMIPEVNLSKISLQRMTLIL